MSEERRIDVRTLIIASLASAVAAIVTSQFWVRGTPIAAALTPVIVTIVSELLHRPTEKIAERFTAETDALPEAAGAEPPPPAEEIAPRPAMDDSIKVYKTARAPSRLNWRVIAATGAAAFVIGAGVLTVTEVIAGGSVGDGARRTTIGGSKKKDKNDAAPTQTVTEPAETVTAPAEAPPETTPKTTSTQPTQTEPQATQTTPAPQQSPPTATTP